MQGINVAEWHSKRVGQKIDLNKGCNFLEFQVGPLFLKPAKYYLAFVLYDKGGLGMPIWSYKKYSMNGATEGSAVYQLP